MRGRSDKGVVDAVRIGRWRDKRLVPKKVERDKATQTEIEVDPAIVIQEEVSQDVRPLNFERISAIGAVQVRTTFSHKPVTVIVLP